MAQPTRVQSEPEERSGVFARSVELTRLWNLTEAEFRAAVESGELTALLGGVEPVDGED